MCIHNEREARSVNHFHFLTSRYRYKAYILNAKNLAPPFLSIFFWNKIDDFKNQCSLVFMPVQLTIVVEK